MEKLKNTIAEFVENVVAALNEDDESVIGIVATRDHAYDILDELETNYECFTDMVKWNQIEDTDTVVICIFNQGETGLVSAQPLYTSGSERTYVIGADFTFVDLDVNLNFIHDQGKDFEFVIFDLEPDSRKCDGDCCNCDYYDEENNEDNEDDVDDKLMSLISAAIDFAKSIVEE